LMANRVLLLLILASRSESGVYSQMLAETAGMDSMSPLSSFLLL